MSFYRGAATALLLVAATSGAETALPEAPRRWVTDRAGFLSPGAVATLDQQLEQFERRTGHQVLVWIERSTGDIPVEDFAVRTFAAWRVGRKGIDDGLVLFVFSADRKARIEVGYGLEPVVTDAVASRAIHDELLPGILRGDHDGAVAATLTRLLAAIDRGGGTAVLAPGGPQPPPAPGRGEGDSRRAPRAGELAVLVVLGVLFLILFITNPSLALWLLFNILSGGRGGGGSGGSGGGGFRGGGGRSGGGGATGSW